MLLSDDRSRPSAETQLELAPIAAAM
jgi:hypothetical protein